MRVLEEDVRGFGRTPEKPGQTGRDKPEYRTTPRSAMAGSDHPRLTVLRVKFS
jgi:hypothetical protein